VSKVEELYKKVCVKGESPSRDELREIREKVQSELTKTDLYFELQILVAATEPTHDLRLFLEKLLSLEIVDENSAVAIQLLESYWPSNTVQNEKLAELAHPRNFNRKSATMIASVEALRNRVQTGRAGKAFLHQLLKLADQGTNFDKDVFDDQQNYRKLIQNAINVNSP
jgi:hypothetical protein